MCKINELLWSEKYQLKSNTLLNSNIAHMLTSHVNISNWFNNFVFIGLLDDIIDPFKTKEICQSNNARFYESKTADHRWFDFSYNSNIIDFVVKK